MRKKKTRATKTPAAIPKRQRRMVCLMNEDEHSIVEDYLEKYKITNRSHWFRETILMHIYKTMEADYPTLFNEHDMRR